MMEIYQYNRSDINEIWLHTHIYVAGIDVVTLTVTVTRNRSQGYTVVIVYIKKMKHQPIKSLYLTVVSVE